MSAAGSVPAPVSSVSVGPRTPNAYPFTYRQRVRFGETDLQGVVYYANYLLYAEVGRVAYLRHLGIDYRRDLIERGLDFTIAEARVRYLAALRFDDEFDIRVRPGPLRRSSWSFEYLVTRAPDDLACAEIETVQVLLDRATGRPARMAPELTSALARDRA